MQIVADTPDTSATIAHMQSINVNKVPENAQLIDCLLYTSDAADDCSIV